MRVPSFSRFQRFMQGMAFFVCGLVVGSAVYSALENTVVNQTILDNYKLQDEVNSLKEDLKDIQQVRKENVIHQITPYIEVPKNKPDLDILTVTELKKALKEDLSIFIGRSIYTINTDAKFAERLLKKKIYNPIGDRDYEVSVKTMLVVDGVLQVWVVAVVHLPK
jgi:hypothetical protein